ncbi:hypothetical protein SMCF_2374, partial [Streptomyces coelicoflavus ZG0656]
MLKYVLDLVDLLDDPDVDGKRVAAHLDSVAGPEGSGAEVTTVTGERGSTDFVLVRIPGRAGRTQGGSARTLGVVGRLGGVGARPEAVGLVSDADG